MLKELNYLWNKTLKTIDLDFDAVKFLNCTLHTLFLREACAD